VSVDTDKETRRSIRAEYESNRTYPTDRICSRLNERSQDYADRLLAEKVRMVRRHRRQGVLVDLCCATGEHLFAIAEPGEQAIGVDFSSLYVAEARRRRNALFGELECEFVCGDARELPFPSNSVTTLYSFSSLYAIPNVRDVVVEIARVLRPGGFCVLDFGNSISLNRIAVRFGYPELPPIFPLALSEILAACRLNGLEIVEHRSFQLLPLWASKPRWLMPLLHPMWARLLSRRVGSRMLDEWVSSVPLLRRLAFRHLLACTKVA
jgi:ubiquinone/menaquinone biosynthesis C-methylase UbiE